ncbi:tRNA (N(6)-L-threonylcarbamoyladenosine(37)-C(2))-methylthiotransferase MtaB, partial [Chloroflexota bacterium]
MHEVLQIALDTVGCKLNQAETELLVRRLAEAGCRLVSSVDEADIYILNTCSVTHIADRKSRHLLRMAHRRNPGARLVVTGCYAQRTPGELAEIDGVSLVIGNEEKADILRLMEESGILRRQETPVRQVEYEDGLRTRAFIKLQDGCSNYCAYCIVPLVRGIEKSLPVEQVISEVNDRVAEGYKEVVLTGTEIGTYNCEGIDLRRLLERIINETDIIRLRLSSIQPQEVSIELIGLWRDRRLCRHFHLSLQSGSDSVLKRMNRLYTTGDYRQAVSLIRSAAPGAAITTDIIVGFPGETDEEFEQSYGFCRQMEFARIHVFSYSAREGTQAVLMPGQVKANIKKQRSMRMLALAGECAKNYRKQFLGETMQVLWEKKSGGN